MNHLQLEQIHLFEISTWLQSSVTLKIGLGLFKVIGIIVVNSCHPVGDS